MSDIRPDEPAPQADRQSWLAVTAATVVSGVAMILIGALFAAVSLGVVALGSALIAHDKKWGLFPLLIGAIGFVIWLIAQVQS